MKLLLSYCMAMLLPMLAFSQSQPNALSLKVAAAKTKKAVFQKTELFQSTGPAKSSAEFEDLLAEGQLMTLDAAALKSLYAANFENLAFSLPTGEKKSMTLELVRQELLTDDFSLVTDASNGQPIDYQPGIYYRGIVEGDEKSVAAVSIFEDEIIAVISTPKQGNMVLGKTGTGAKAATYVFYKDDDLLVDQGFLCETEDIPVNSDKEPMAGGGEKVAKCVRAYLELEYNLVTEKGGATGATNFITGLYNVVAALYQNEAITTTVSQIFTWTTPDPFATSSTSAALTSFRNYRTSYNGDLAHLISRGAPTGGGIAWVSALCTNYGYAYSYINSTYSALPNYSWSANVLTHEMGHNLGSQHTHACAWNNNNNTAIDGCGPAVGANEGCNAAIPASGTMMSYCHLVNGVGINFSNGFGAQPGDRIRAKITAASCLVVCSSGCVTVATSGNNAACFGSANGTATATATGGNAPYVYAWSNGATGAAITGLAAGTYTVTVTSATGCTGTGARIVTQPTALSVNLSVTNASSGNNGAISSSVSGGTPNYTYKWSNGPTTANISGLAVGTYTVTVTDSKGCSATKSATVQAGAATAITLGFSVTNANAGQSNGAVNLTVSGGVPGYSYTWSNGATTQDLANVAAGTYTVTVLDAAGSAKTGSATVGSIAAGGCNPVALPHNNSFENTLGNWSQATNDQFNWAIRSGTTPTSGTGPNGAINGTYYVYAEATGNANKTAYLLSPCFNINGVSNFSISYSYNMYGSQMGILKLEYSLNGGTSWSTFWSRSGNQGTNWRNQSITFTNNGLTNIRFRFNAKINGDKSDIAVDNVNILSVGNLPGDGFDEETVHLGLEETTALALTPNPANDQLSISFFSTEGQEAQVRVSDQTGRLISNDKIEAYKGQNEHRLDVSALPSGLYFLTILEGQHKRVEKFVVLR